MLDGLPSITIAQINPTLGDLNGNTRKILDVWSNNKDTELVVFPEMVVCGYPPEDLVLKPFFLDQIESCVKRLCTEGKNFASAALISAPWRADSKIYNAAILVDDGNIVDIRYKHHLPDYGVFDETRIFKAGPRPDPVEFRGHKLGILVCEDMWYTDVSAHLKEQGAEILIVPNGSPFDSEKNDVRLHHAHLRVQETGLPLVYVNQVGGQDELVFDGGSFALNAKGELITQARQFEEHVLTVSSGKIATLPLEEEAIHGALVLGLRDYITKNGFPGIVLGLSGGIDSALSAVIAVEALGADNVHAVMMPSRFTSNDSLEDAKALADNLGIKLDTIDIEPMVEAYNSALEPHATATESPVAYENIQSRVRGTMLMALSNATGAMVLSTGNKSEIAVGYATLYGDMNGGFNALKDLYKTQVYTLSRWINRKREIIPERIITKAPTAELKADQTDQDTLPPYDVLDDILQCLIERDMGIEAITDRSHNAKLVARVWQMLDRAEYKRRQACPGVKITARAFGRDRRYPITNQFVNILKT